jgi:hypothetical protein
MRTGYEHTRLDSRKEISVQGQRATDEYHCLGTEPERPETLESTEKTGRQVTPDFTTLPLC